MSYLGCFLCMNLFEPNFSNHSHLLPQTKSTFTFYIYMGYTMTEERNTASLLQIRPCPLVLDDSLT